MPRFIVRGQLQEEDGTAVPGSAVKIANEVVYTNSEGEFFVRLKKKGSYPMEVLTNEFLEPVSYEIVQSPQERVGSAEEEATPLIIIVRRTSEAVAVRH